ncbi:MAG: hypothetical protein LDLANPLL_01918 [Turneriella sp.]|nr:hypothetical protein [Turneriella sp.]
MQVHGEWDSRFKNLVAAFEKNFNTKEDYGAALCVFHKGTKVVDVWGGVKDTKSKEPWGENTLATIFSVTKALTSLCFLILATRKKFDYEKTVASYWPHFALSGKTDITCQVLLEHRAGLYALDRKLSIYDFIDNPQKAYDALIYQKPVARPGEIQGYGAQAWGAYAAELFKQVTGESIGTFFSREVAKPLGVDAYIGLPDSKQDAVATVYPVSAFERVAMVALDAFKGDTTEARIARALISGDTSIQRAYTNPSMGDLGLRAFNEPKVRSAELAWANGIANARALATIMDVLAAGGKKGKADFANPSLVQLLTYENPLRYDRVLQKRLGWNLGFLKEETHLFSPNTETFGHTGMGGSLTFADPKTQLSFGYVCNKMDYKLRPDKTIALCHALYSCV